MRTGRELRLRRLRTRHRHPRGRRVLHRHRERRGAGVVGGVGHRTGHRGDPDREHVTRHQRTGRRTRRNEDPSTASVAEPFEKVATAPAALAASTVTFAGGATTGAVVSCTVTVNVAVPVLPAASVALQVRSSPQREHVTRHQRTSSRTRRRQHPIHQIQRRTVREGRDRTRSAGRLDRHVRRRAHHWRRRVRHRHRERRRPRVVGLVGRRTGHRGDPQREHVTRAQQAGRTRRRRRAVDHVRSSACREGRRRTRRPSCLHHHVRRRRHHRSRRVLHRDGERRRPRVVGQVRRRAGHRGDPQREHITGSERPGRRTRRAQHTINQIQRRAVRERHVRTRRVPSASTAMRRRRRHHWRGRCRAR